MNLFKFFNNIYDQETAEKLAFLKRSLLFEKIPKRKLIHVLEVLKECTYIKGENIFKEGEIGRALFIVRSGKINISRTMSDGSQKLVSEVKSGEFFGEMALIDENPRSATAIASEDTKVFLLFKIKLDTLLYAQPAIGVVIAVALAKILSARLRCTMEVKDKEKNCA